MANKDCFTILLRLLHNQHEIRKEYLLSEGRHLKFKLAAHDAEAPLASNRKMIVSRPCTRARFGRAGCGHARFWFWLTFV